MIYKMKNRIISWLFLVVFFNFYGNYAYAIENNSQNEIHKMLENIENNYDKIIVNNSSNFSKEIGIDNNSKLIYKKEINSINLNKASVIDINSSTNYINNESNDTYGNNNKNNNLLEYGKIFNSDNHLLVFISSSISDLVLDNYILYLKEHYSKLNIPVVFVLKGCIESSYSQSCDDFRKTASFAKRFLINNDQDFEKVRLVIDPKLFKEFDISLVPTFLFYNKLSNLSYLSAGDGSFKYHIDLLENLSDAVIFNN